MSRELIVLPEDTIQPIVNAIENASRSLRIKMFVFSDPTLLKASIDAHHRGVNVRVMLNPARRSGEQENDPARTLLTEAGITVIDSNPAFDLTHEKSMVVDDTIGFIKSLNWDSKNFSGTRDYAIVTSHKHEVNEIIECFEADWRRTPFFSGEHTHMIWCTGNGRQRLGELIDSARHSLWLQNERYQDPVMIEHLVRAKLRGVSVHVMARPPHKLKKDKLSEGVAGLRILEDVGVKIHKLKQLKLHAKLILADGERAVVGSINLAPGSFDSRRELAIEVRDRHIVDRLVSTVEHDWKNSRPIDLTDESLLAELGEMDANIREDLALKCEERAKHRE